MAAHVHSILRAPLETQIFSYGPGPFLRLTLSSSAVEAGLGQRVGFLPGANPRGIEST
jgi:hypothetical protein